MLTYLLILFVVALAIAPLGHLLPSKRQRKVARLREYAAVHGLFVEFREVPTGSVPAAARVSPRDVIYYGRRITAKRAVPVVTGRWIQASEGWRSVGRRLPVPGLLQNLPSDILAASVDEGSCGVYWVESSGEEAVEGIRQALECWNEELLR